MNKRKILQVKNNEICLISIVPKWVGGISLSLVVLKSYLLSVKPDLNISLHTFFSDDDAADIARSLLAKKYQIYGFSIYMWNFETAARVTRLLKEEAPGSFVIWGGPTASFDAAPILENNPSVDMIIEGEGEIPFLEVVSELEVQDPDFSAIPNLLLRKNGRVIRTPSEACILALEKQHHPLDIHAFEGIKTVYYETSRGCVFQCNYCAWNVNQCGIKGVRLYPLEKVAGELRELFNLPQLEMLLLTDSNILLGGERTRKIFSIINGLNRDRREKHRPLVKINFEFNPEHLKESMLPEIKKLHVENYPIGLQSVNPEVLKVANRSFNKTRYVESIRKLRGKIGAAILVEIIYGLPTDTYEGFKQTLEFVMSELAADLFVCYRYSVLPGSVFWKDREKYGIRHEPGPPYLILSSNTFSGEDLKRSQELAYYLQIIYRVFRSLKKSIDNSVCEGKIEIYEAIAALLKKKYRDFLEPKLVYDDGFLEDVAKLRDHKNAAVRHRMMSDARQIIKEFTSRSLSGRQTDC
jgi:radical SAM superfamily enzyme YgiQ (UPF0313 family)